MLSQGEGHTEQSERLQLQDWLSVVRKGRFLTWNVSWFLCIQVNLSQQEMGCPLIFGFILTLLTVPRFRPVFLPTPTC